MLLVIIFSVTGLSGFSVVSGIFPLPITTVVTVDNWPGRRVVKLLIEVAGFVFVITPSPIFGRVQIDPLRNSAFVQLKKETIDFLK